MHPCRGFIQIPFPLAYHLPGFFNSSKSSSQSYLQVGRGFLGVVTTSLTSLHPRFVCLLVFLFWKGAKISCTCRRHFGVSAQLTRQNLPHFLSSEPPQTGLSPLNSACTNHSGSHCSHRNGTTVDTWPEWANQMPSLGVSGTRWRDSVDLEVMGSCLSPRG